LIAPRSKQQRLVRCLDQAEVIYTDIPDQHPLGADVSALEQSPPRMEAFNIFDPIVSDIDYFYASRLSGEPACSPNGAE
jgi:hypothetical protein